MIEYAALRLIAAFLVSVTALVLIPGSDDRNRGNQPVLDVPASLPPWPTVPHRTGPETTVEPRPLVGYADNCDDVARLAIKVGWPPELLAHLTRIAFRESACKSWAFNPRDVDGGSRGLLQLNGAHTKPTPWNPDGFFQSLNIGVTEADDLFNAELNLRAGLALYRYAQRHYGDGWQPWAATRDK